MSIRRLLLLLICCVFAFGGSFNCHSGDDKGSTVIVRTQDAK